MAQSRRCKPWIVLAGVVLLSGCGFFEAPAPSEEWIVVDTRTEGEFRRSHVRGALHIPYDSVRGHLSRLPTDWDQPIIVYCTVGVRAATAARALEGAGYRQVRNAGGLRQMENAGWPVVTGESRVTADPAR